MKWFTTAGLAAALVAAAGVGAAFAPMAEAQSRAPRAAEVFAFAGGGRIGVSISDLDAEDIKGKVNSGVVIDEVESDSPAAKAGLRKGDIVVEFDGERVRSVRQFTRLVSETPAGRAVSAAVMRDGQRVSVNITPRESDAFRMLDSDRWISRIPSVRPAIPAPPPAPRPPAVPRSPMIESFLWGGNRLGVAIEDLSPQLAEYFGAKDGVLVSSVESDSAAAKAGVKAGDVITSVNGNSVESGTELRRRLSNLEAGDEFTLGITRDKRSMTLKGKLERAPQRRRMSRTIL